MRTALAALALLGVIGTSQGAMSPPPHAASTTPAVVVRREPHPEIRAAIRALERSKEHLRRAAHDFGGHRVEAIAAIDAALAQLNACLEYDR